MLTIIHPTWVICLLFALAAPSMADNPVPAELPKPDAAPPSKKQPVKVYIQSGQSNSVGFGVIEGGGIHYNTFFLSADTRLKTHNMSISNDGMLPFLLTESESGDATGSSASIYEGNLTSDNIGDKKPVKTLDFDLGAVGTPLPSIEGDHTVVIKAWIEVPISCNYQIHPGTGKSAVSTAQIGDQVVYDKTSENAPVTFNYIHLEKGKRHPLTIVYHQGGESALWLQTAQMQPKGTLETLTKAGKYQTFVDDQGKWTVRNDVALNNAYLGKGKNVPLSPANLSQFGPELGFGYVLGTFHDEPVIIIKADIGNRGLAWDILPPGSERYEIDGIVYAGYKDSQSSWPKEQGGPKPGVWYAGKQYDEYSEAIHRELKALPEKYPQWADQGFEVAGFVWWQGHKDQNPVHASRYEINLVNLIKAWRKEFNAPKANFVLATIAFGGWNLSGPGKTIAEAQLAVSGETGKYQEFKGNVKTIEARSFWRNIGESPKDQDYHYHHNAETYFLVGDALGRAMVELEGGKAEQRKYDPRPKPKTSWPEKPTLDEAVEMIMSDAFIGEYARDEAEPTEKEMLMMSPIYRPIIVDKLIPEYVKMAPGAPGHSRFGGPMANLLTGEAPTNIRNKGLITQFDKVISLYNSAGVHDYDWKVLTPELKESEWWYHSFKPKEPVSPKSLVQYRNISMPAGMENWHTKDFDPAAAGWKQGKSPFGQNNGNKAPLQEKCDIPQCGCDKMPNTLWENDALVMRQTVKIPKLDSENNVYRLIVGGGSHTWAGEGYEVYVNGKLFDKMESGFYKNGGYRGSNLYNDFLTDFESGEATIAVKCFLRRSSHSNTEAPPSGHISLWLEEAKLPVILKDLRNELMKPKK